MAAKVNLKDVEAAAAIVTKLNNAISELSAVVNTQKSMSEDIAILNQTIRLNEQAADFLQGISSDLAKLIPNLEEVSTQLSAAVKSMQGFEQLASEGFLGRV